MIIQENPLRDFKMCLLTPLPCRSRL
jgi:hypothetical protein